LRSRRYGAGARGWELGAGCVPLRQYGAVSAGLEDACRLREELRSFLGVDAVPAAAPRVEMLSAVQEDGFTCQLVRLVAGHDTIPSFLAVPDGDGPFPAVLVFH
jgi:hypothetical protein